MAYGYLDEYGILHIVDNEAMAKDFATSKVVKTDVPNGEGYPKYDGKHIRVYTKEGKYKVGKVEHPIADLSKNYPAVAALVKELA